MADTEEPFAALLARARLGDEGAITQLVRQYEPEVRRVAHARLGPALRPFLDSMDVVNSVHRSLLLGLRANKFDLHVPENLVALAVTMVWRKISRHWRRLRPEIERRVDFDHLEAILIPSGHTGDDPLRTACLRDQVRELVRNLNDRERCLLELRLEGYSTAAIGRRLGLDDNVLRVQLGRLRQRLYTCGVFSDWL